jgi:TolA protein
MRGPSLQKTAAVSLMLHMTFLVLSVILMRYSNNFIAPLPYTVNLVYPEKPGRSLKGSSSITDESQSKAVEKGKSTEASKTVIKADSKADEDILNEKLTALKAKAGAIDKLTRKSEIRKKIAEISGKVDATKSTGRPSEKPGAAGGQKGTPTDMYIAKISDEIWKEWIWPPEMGRKDLETVVSVTIGRDGYIKINRIEKSSGNIRFNNSALHAINKANPVTPPPYEMEIGIRFTP